MQQKAREANAKTVAAEGRHELASLIYYLRNAPQPVRSWPVGDNPDNQFDMTSALEARRAEPILFVTACPFEGRLARVFPQVKPLGAVTVVRSGPISERRYGLFLLSGKASRSGPIPPLGRCEG